MSTVLTLSVPAESAFAAVARTAAASLAARAGATVDGVEDVRAVAAELVALAITSAPPGGTADLAFTVDGPEIAVELRTVTAGGTLPSTESFAWTILDALTSGLSATVEPGPDGQVLVVGGRVRLSVPA
jgi:serine/threonine-protein kinase RsbW